MNRKFPDLNASLKVRVHNHHTRRTTRRISPATKGYVSFYFVPYSRKGNPILTLERSVENRERHIRKTVDEREKSVKVY